MQNPLELLRSDHQNILYALWLLDAITTRMNQGTQANAEDLRGFLRFLKEFADAYHHGKEEGFLFPALVKAGIPHPQGPVDVMLDEHTQGRAWIQDMEAALSDTVDISKFTRAATEYKTLMEGHIQKENNILFRMAERMLPPNVLEQLLGDFSVHEERTMGKEHFDELNAILQSLQQKYAPSA